MHITPVFAKSKSKRGSVNELEISIPSCSIKIKLQFS